jgi:acetyl esterase
MRRRDVDVRPGQNLRIRCEFTEIITDRGTPMLVRPRSRRVVGLGVIAVILTATWQSWGRPLRFFDVRKPSPDVSNIRYGPHDRNVFDLWKAKPQRGLEARTPLVIFFHGGAFRTGDKSHVPAKLIETCLAEGISVASANYRLSITAAFPAPMLDGARAVQFVRKNAAELGIDPSRIAAAGSSAGAGIALWIGFHDDLADPRSGDPIARQSSRVTCLGVDGAQTSYDPRFIKKLIGGRAYEHPALREFYGIKTDADLDSPATHKLYEEASPLNFVSAGDPPAILFYAEPNAPLPADAKPGQGIHHPRFGEALKARLDQHKIDCILRHRSEYPPNDDPKDSMSRDMTAFFVREFRKP